MKIYKTWNFKIAQLFPIFRDQDFIVFVPGTADEKKFLFNFFSFLSSFVEDFEKAYKELEKRGIHLTGEELNEKLLPLLKTNKFFLFTTLEEYIIPRDTFIEMLKLIQDTLSYDNQINNKSFKEILDDGLFENPEKEEAFFFKDNKIEVVQPNLIVDKEITEDLNKFDFEKELNKFIEFIFSKFDKKKSN